MPQTSSKVLLGDQRAKIRAAQDKEAARVLYRNNADTLQRCCGGAPIGLFVGHLMRVNPTGVAQPRNTQDGRVGFLKVSALESSAANVSWSAITSAKDMTLNTFVWSHALNTTARDTLDILGNLTTSPDPSFWKLSYMQLTLGYAAFYSVWKHRNTSIDDLYMSFMDSLASYKKPIAGWSPLKIQQTLLKDCPYVFYIAEGFGRLATTAYGSLPVLPANTRTPSVIASSGVSP
jgi:hypothetical protein